MKNKKPVYILIAVILVACLSAAALYATGDELSFVSNSDGTGYIVNGIGTYREDDIVVPEYHNGKPVVSVAARAFEQRTNISSVTLPASVTKLGDFAFSGCTSLKNVYFAEGLVSMGKGAFYNCTSLESFDLPQSLSVIGDWAFWNCAKVTSVSLPGHLSSVGIGAFSGCARLSSLNIGTSLSSLSQYVFADCIALRSVTVPSNITSIGEYAFADCYNLSELFFSNSGVSINGKAFYGVTAKAHYPCNNSSWSGFSFKNYGGTLTWVSHTNVTHYPAVPATEESEGSIEYWYCSDCGRYFSDEACTHEISQGSIITPPIGQNIRGDVDGNGIKNGDDVLRSLYHLFYPEVYTVNQDLDFNGDGKENGDDILRLLYNLFYEDVYPLI